GSELAKYGACGVGESGRWQSTQNCLRIGVQRSVLNWVESDGNTRVPPTVWSGGATSWTFSDAPAPPPSQFWIQVSMVSPQACAEATQQLWPPPTFATSSDWPGSFAFTSESAAW